MSLTHLETIELGSSQSSITFSSIPQDYDDLVVVYSARKFANGDVIFIATTEINGSQANLSSIILEGDGSNASSFSRSDFLIRFPGENTPTSLFGNGQVYFSNYTSSSSKSISSDTVSPLQSATGYLHLVSGLWANSSAITSLTFSPTSSQSFDADTTFSLYGVTAGGDGTVTTA